MGRVGTRRAAGVGVVLLAWATAAAPAPRVVNIGVVVDGPWVGNDGVLALTVAEVEALTEGEFDVRFPREAYLVGDWTLETAKENLDRLLAAPEVDLVITWGLLASHAVCCLGAPAKPVVAPVIIDVDLQGVPFANGASGLPNLNYVALPDDLADEILAFLDVVPFEHVAILTNAALVEAIPELEARTARSLAGLGVDFDFVPVRDSAAEALAAISDDADAVFAWPLFQLTPAEFQRFVDGLNERRLPSFSALGGTELEAGMLASATDETFFNRLTRRVALNIQRILLGEDAGSLPVEFASRSSLTINMATARAIDVSPRWEVLIEANLLNAEDDEGGHRLTLREAIEEALLVNLDLATEERVVEAGVQNVDVSRAALRPRLDLALLGTQIDETLAASSFGSRAERTATASVSLSQLLYSDAALGNLSVQRRLQEAREHAFESLRLDVALEAARSYLDLLRARALERIQKNNVQQIRSNLDLARIRRALGVAAAGEVLRWENELAAARKSLVEATGGRRAAEIGVNRVLHRPLEQPFAPEEVGLETPGFPADRERFRSYVETPKRFRIFSRYLVLEGLARAPEIARLDASIAAQRSVLATARRAFWSPTLGLEAAFEDVVARGGVGAAGFGEIFDFELPPIDDTSWSVGIGASLPLFTGGSRAAEKVRAEIELERLLLVRAATEERLELRIRAALERMRASFIGIRFAAESAAAGRDNRALVEDAYARGAASLLDLLDAQTAELNAEEQAANALYDFLDDWVETHRAANILELIMNVDRQSEFMAALDEHFAAQGIALRAAGIRRQER